MDETQNRTNNEIDLSDSWTIVNNDDPEGNINTEVAETSDAESLEVLEVEQGEPEDSGQDEHEREEEKCCSEECTDKNCNDSFVLQDPLIHIATVQKVRKYVHHPSAYVNMWLSIVMVIAVAITVGLGIGHYLGSKRFARAKDMIHHLKYENQMLEQELADVSMKYNYCEKDMRDRDIVYSSWRHDSDDVCYAEDNPLKKQLFKDHVVNESMPMLLQWFTYVDVDGEQDIFYPFENVFFRNGSFINTKNNIKGDASFNVNNLFPKETADKIFSTKTHISVSKLNTQLMYLRSLVKKWGDFREILQLHTVTHKLKYHNGLLTTKDHNDITRKTLPHVSGSSNDMPSCNVKHTTTISSNGCYRSKVKQCYFHEEKLGYKDSHCKVLSKAQMFCSLLSRSQRKSARILDRKQKVHENNVKKPKVSRYAFDKKRNKKSDNSSKSYSSVGNKHKRKLAFTNAIDNQYLKFREEEENYVQKHFKVKKGGSKEKIYSSGSKRIGKGGNYEKDNCKHKYFVKNHGILEKEKTHQFRIPNEKQVFKLTQKKKPFKKFIELNKQTEKYDSKRKLKYKDKKAKVIWNRSDKSRTHDKNRNYAKLLKKNYIDKRFLVDTKMGEIIKDDCNCYHSKLGLPGNFFKLRNNNTKKNDSNYPFKYASNKQKGKDEQKEWKERSKMYNIRVKEIKVVKS